MTLDEVRARHFERRGQMCAYCGPPWPCDAVQALAALDAAEAEISKQVDGAAAWHEAAKLAEQDAARLAEALKTAHWLAHNVAHAICPEPCAARAALAQHRERQP